MVHNSTGLFGGETKNFEITKKANDYEIIHQLPLSGIVVNRKKITLRNGVCTLLKFGTIFLTHGT